MLKELSSQHIDELLAGFLIRAKSFVIANYLQASRYYIAALLVTTLAFMMVMPVGSGDTDLWYHLNGGRLFWELGQFPDTAFYSFMDTQRGWVNYFWGFQALSYQVHKHLGYEGLILVRLILIGISFLSIAILLIRPQDRPAQRAWALVLLVLVLLVLVGRTGQIRPHLVSYAMIPLFLLILEYRRNWLPALPALTVLWVNLHGVEWPVGGVICGAYFIEAIWHGYRNRADHHVVDRRVLIWTIACLPAMLINPVGFLIFGAPFNTPTDAYLYIAELQPNPLLGLFSVSLAGPIISLTSAIALLNWGNLISYLFLFLRRRIRPAPLIMSLAGIFLLSRGNRFIWEWLLLSLPLWRSAIDAQHADPDQAKDSGITVANLMVIIVLLAPAVSWFIQARGFHHWPVDKSGLPVGTAAFLRDQQVAGKLLAPPNYGGYLAWKLYPKILNSGDMQIPPTTPWDNFQNTWAVRDANALQRMIAEFQPHLIGVEISNKSFRDLIKGQVAYRPVFFGDKLALYADAAQLPDLVAQHELKHVNPFNLLDDKIGTIDERLSELKAVLPFNPDGDRVQHAITRILFDEKKFNIALPFAQQFAHSVPENPNSNYLLGNVLENLDRCAEARAHYLQAFAVAEEDFYPELHRHLGACAYLKKDFSTAFVHFEQGVNPYTRQEEPEYLYQFALAAFAVGKEDRARTLLTQLIHLASDEDSLIVEKAQSLMADL